MVYNGYAYTLKFHSLVVTRNKLLYHLFKGCHYMNRVSLWTSVHPSRNHAAAESAHSWTPLRTQHILYVKFWPRSVLQLELILGGSWSYRRCWVLKTESWRNSLLWFWYCIGSCKSGVEFSRRINRRPWSDLPFRQQLALRRRYNNSFPVPSSVWLRNSLVRNFVHINIFVFLLHMFLQLII